MTLKAWYIIGFVLIGLAGVLSVWMSFFWTDLIVFPGLLVGWFYFGRKLLFTEPPK